MTDLTREELELQENALTYVKSHTKEIVARFAPPLDCHPVENPVSLFMAGSPGAGKTEVSKSLIKKFNDTPIRIDADDIRPLCPGYTGLNAHIFQKAANKGVNILYDYALDKKLNCILDGTFAYGDAEGNIQRSISRGRRVEIWFVYQEPVKAWKLTKVRESKENRHVSKEIFIKAFKNARANVKAVKDKFGNSVELNVLTKDYSSGTEEFQLNASSGDLDRLTASSYPLEELDKLLI